MTGIDTNVLVRYLTADDQTQFAQADRFLNEEISAAQPGFVSSIALCELIWVLGRAYGVTRVALAVLIEKLLNMPQIQIEAEATTWRALSDFRTSNADFPDCLMGQLNREAGCDTTRSFDTKAAKLETFTLLATDNDAA